MRNPKTSLIAGMALFLATLAPSAFGESMFNADEIAQTCEFSQLDKPIKPIRQEAPTIPSELKGVKASVQVAFIIDENGHVVKPRIVQCSNDSFREIALSNASKWEFQAGTKAGKPVAVRVVVPIRFNSERGK